MHKYEADRISQRLGLVANFGILTTKSFNLGGLPYGLRVINIHLLYNIKMNQKTQRFAIIRKIIRSEQISSQEELIARLSENGVEITQSTLSRDLKFMNVAKVPHKNKGYVYVLPNSTHHEVNVSANISDNITGLTFSGNLGVLKTKSGYASAISVPIDNLDCPSILGTIAGDNTVLIILKEDAKRKEVMDTLLRIFPMLSNIL